MYAIVEMAGQQFKVAKDQKVFVHRLGSEEGQKVTFDNVLLLDDGKNVTIGAPAIDGAAVEAKIVRHLKGDKVIVFKKKRRKGYRKKNGHRQYLTEILVEDILASGAKKAAPTTTKKAKPETKKSEDKQSVKTEAPQAVAKEPAKGVDPKKEEAKKAEPKKAAPAKTKAKGDDLKKIEGIGPKAAEALTNAGIGTFAELAAADPDNIKEILTEASSRLAHLEPATWPEQAQLAADDKWDELKALQEKLDGGRK